mmetsp:Transcript_35537/g.92912  ORF Transcript_35537/g.92912 Transcript_35537/m.92912 type:complete len:361 (-) Transcript_35537:1506-2588(-)
MRVTVCNPGGLRWEEDRTPSLFPALLLSARRPTPGPGQWFVRCSCSCAATRSHPQVGHRTLDAAGPLAVDEDSRPLQPGGTSLSAALLLSATPDPAIWRVRRLARRSCCCVRRNSSSMALDCSLRSLLGSASGEKHVGLNNGETSAGSEGIKSTWICADLVEMLEPTPTEAVATKSVCVDTSSTSGRAGPARPSAPGRESTSGHATESDTGVPEADARVVLEAKSLCSVASSHKDGRTGSNNLENGRRILDMKSSPQSIRSCCNQPPTHSSPDCCTPTSAVNTAAAAFPGCACVTQRSQIAPTGHGVGHSNSSDAATCCPHTPHQHFPPAPRVAPGTPHEQHLGSLAWSRKWFMVSRCRS